MKAVPTVVGLPVSVSAANTCVSTGISDDMKKLSAEKKLILKFCNS